MTIGESIEELKELIAFKEKQLDKVLSSIPDKIAVMNIRLILEQQKELQYRLDVYEAPNQYKKYKTNTMTTHLRLGCYYGTNGEHPQLTMKRHGITYQYAVPQTISSEWWFFNCENVPSPLPERITVLNCEDPYRLVGWGLDEEMAENIKNYDSKKHREKTEKTNQLLQKILNNTTHDEH
jgi:hypothetical protein